MAVSKCTCLTLSRVNVMLDAKISLAPSHQLIVPSTLMASAIEIRTHKATNNVQFVLKLLRDLKKKTVLRVSPPSVKPVYNKSACCKLPKILIVDQIKLHGSRDIQWSYVTGFKTNLLWAGKLAHIQILLQNVKVLSSFCYDFLQPATA